MKKVRGGSSSAEGASAARGVRGHAPGFFFSIFSTLEHVFLHF